MSRIKSQGNWCAGLVACLALLGICIVTAVGVFTLTQVCLRTLKATTSSTADAAEPRVALLQLEARVAELERQLRMQQQQEPKIVTAETGPQGPVPLDPAGQRGPTGPEGLRGPPPPPKSTEPTESHCTAEPPQQSEIHGVLVDLLLYLCRVFRQVADAWFGVSVALVRFAALCVRTIIVYVVFFLDSVIPERGTLASEWNKYVRDQLTSVHDEWRARWNSETCKSMLGPELKDALKEICMIIRFSAELCYLSCIDLLRALKLCVRTVHVYFASLSNRKSSQLQQEVAAEIRDVNAQWDVIEIRARNRLSLLWHDIQVGNKLMTVCMRRIRLGLISLFK
jgi:hypothetical protein